MKKICMILLFVSQFYSGQSFGQFRMTSAGAVGIGTANPQGKCEVHGGNFYVTGVNGNTFRFAPDNPGTEIGTSYGGINFWYTTTGWNYLSAGGFYLGSDSTLKDSIVPISKGLSYVLRLKGYSYNLKADISQNKRKYYGFLAQEMKNVIKDIVDTAIVDSTKKLLVANYDEVIPFLVEALKEQQRTIDSLKEQFDSIKRVISTAENNIAGIIERCCPLEQKSLLEDNSKKTNISTAAFNNENILFQNIPNPFSKSTIIKYYLNDRVNKGSIVLYDMLGKKVRTFDNLSIGLGNIMIKGTELNPGTYSYLLIADENVVDSKILIITRE